MIYSVALPIGNAEDISRRASKLLSQVDIIACEDQRKLKDQLRRCGIITSARFMSHHAHNEQNSAVGLLKLAQAGKSIAIVSDAGTPMLSDPGGRFIKLCWDNNIVVQPLPGPSALMSLAMVSPFPLKPFIFLGFAGIKKGGIIKLLNNYVDFQGIVIFYESVHRISKFLSLIHETWGNLEVFIGREMTKIHEEFYYGNIVDAISWSEKKRGEFAFMVNKREKKLKKAEKV